MENKKRLLDEFQPHTYEGWKDAAVALLKGAPFEKKLFTKLCDGITLNPSYFPDDLAGVAGLDELPGASSRRRGTAKTGYIDTPWLISQELPYSSPDEFNRIALEAVEKGQTELVIPLDNAVRNGRDPDESEVGEVGNLGLSLATVDDISVALKGIDLTKTSLYFKTGTAALAVTTLLLAYAKQKGIDPQKIKGCVEADPLGNLAYAGKLNISLDTAWRNIAGLIKYLNKNAPGLQCVVVQGHPYHDGGASGVQELSLVVATLVTYIRELQKYDIEPAMVAKHLRIGLSIGSNFFGEIAKIRAARMLVTRVFELFGVDTTDFTFHVHGRGSRWNKTVYDPYVNMLRSTTEGLAGVLASVDSMHLEPFDAIFRQPDSFSRRIARNIHHVLAEECYLRATIDPAGGSWYVEKLTEEFAENAWKAFQDIEKNGGIISQLQKGDIQKQIDEVAAGRFKQIAQRREVIVGTNNYPNPLEKPLENRLPDFQTIYSRRSIEIEQYRRKSGFVYDQQAMQSFAQDLSKNPIKAIEDAIDALLSGATLGDMTKALWQGSGEHFHSAFVVQRRASEQYERLRKACEKAVAKYGTIPRIFQINYGQSRFYRARADWVSGFFQVGGFEVINDSDFESVEEAVHAAYLAQTSVVVIVGTDETYAEHAEQIAQKVRSSMPNAVILLAGAPGENEQQLRAAGISDFIHMKVNNYQMLEHLLMRLKVIS